MLCHLLASQASPRYKAAFIVPSKSIVPGVLLKSSCLGPDDQGWTWALQRDPWCWGWHRGQSLWCCLSLSSDNLQSMKAVLVLETRKSLVLEKGVWGAGKVGDIDMCVEGRLETQFWVFGVQGKLGTHFWVWREDWRHRVGSVGAMRIRGTVLDL